MSDILKRLRDALETAAGQFGPVTDEQRNEWLALVAEADAHAAPVIDVTQDEGDSAA